MPQGKEGGRSKVHQQVNTGLCAKSKARDEWEPGDPQESKVVQAENVFRGSSYMPGPRSVCESKAVDFP